MAGKPPRYALPPHEFQLRGLASLAGRSSSGADREIALATLVAARLALGALSPDRLPLKSREARAAAARNWMLSLPLPQPTRATYMRLLEATGTDDIEYLSTSFTEVIEIADEALDAASRLELGRVVTRISSERSVEALERPARAGS
jgi:hypothetical protein